MFKEDLEVIFTEDDTQNEWGISFGERSQV